MHYKVHILCVIERQKCHQVEHVVWQNGRLACMLNAVCTRYTIGHASYFKTCDQFVSKNQSKGITLETMVTKMSYEDSYL